jgi:hypothetical protein
MSFNRRFWFTTALAAVGALTATGVVLANTITITDGNKTRGPLDIRTASAGHASSTKLLHSVETVGRIPRSRRAGVCLRIYFAKPDRGDPFDRVICASGRDEEAHINGSGPDSDKSFGFVRVLGDGNVRAFRFRASSAIGDRNHYWWALDTFYNARRGPCNPTCGDSAPNGARTVLHSLGS